MTKKIDLFSAFKSQYQKIAADMTRGQGKRAACSIAATRVVNRVFKLRKQYAWVLLKALRGISKLKIVDESDFGERLHSVHNEPFFYESAYKFVSRPSVMSIDSRGQFRPHSGADELDPTTWSCGNKCKPLTSSDIASILDFKCGFDKPSLSEVRKLLDNCDICPNTHYHKTHSATDNDSFSAPLRGHSFLCYTGKECESMLKILRVASTHFPKLNSLLCLHCVDTD